MILPTLVRMFDGLSAKNSTAAKKHREKTPSTTGESLPTAGTTPTE